MIDLFNDKKIKRLENTVIVLSNHAVDQAHAITQLMADVKVLQQQQKNLEKVK